MFGLHPLSLAVGGALGALATAFYYSMTRSPALDGSSHGMGYHPSPLHGRIVPGPLPTSPSGGRAPTAGYASSDAYEWAYVLGDGDSAGGIAEAITGDDGRYQELLLANPSLPTSGEPGVYLGDNAWEPAAGAFKPGEHLLLPIPWSRYIDQTGAPRGSRIPFPADPRGVLVSGADDEEHGYAPPPRAMTAGAPRAAGGAAAPYGSPIAIPRAA